MNHQRPADAIATYASQRGAVVVLQITRQIALLIVLQITVLLLLSYPTRSYAQNRLADVQPTTRADGSSADPTPVPADDLLKRGEYLTYVAGCHACHTDHRNNGEFLAGGAPIATPFGEFYPPNITPDSETGIGGWSDDEFAQALQHGIAPDGRRYYPVFPYTSYSRLRVDDVRAIKRYLDQLTPVRRSNTAHVLRGLARLPALLGLWQWLNLKPEWTALPDHAEANVRAGAYLVEAVGHCGECHSPRDGIGATRYRDWLRGTRLPSGHQATNLTPHPDGLAAWETEELVSFLHTGRTDMGTKARHEMREFVDHAARYLTEADRQAIVAYLNVQPARSDVAVCKQNGPRQRYCRR